jgi:hypothetical protein
MNHKSNGGNWDALREHPDLARADIALLCEATLSRSGRTPLG